MGQASQLRTKSVLPPFSYDAFICLRWAESSCFDVVSACISPDYIIVTRDKHAALLQALQKEYERVFPCEDLKQDDYPRIASVHHWDRLKGLIDKSKGKVLRLGQMDRESRLMGVTLLDDVAWNDAVMQEWVVTLLALPLRCYCLTWSIS